MWVLLFALAQDPGSGYDRWYEVLMGDDRVGSMHAVSASSPDGTRRVESSTVMDILRAGTLIHWSMVVESVEGPDGAPLSVRVEQAQGGQATTSVLRFADGEALLSVSAGGRELPEARAAYGEAGNSAAFGSLFT
ncbi:MAG TPA: hypothetical protein PKA64_11130, partial [Myxococcota bacterium]|nr:hypothetical protein [Myxococcota bacterium]